MWNPTLIDQSDAWLTFGLCRTFWIGFCWQEVLASEEIVSRGGGHAVCRGGSRLPKWRSFVDEEPAEVKARFWAGAESEAHCSTQAGLFRIRQRCRPDSKHEPEPWHKEIEACVWIGLRPQPKTSPDNLSCLSMSHAARMTL